MNPEVVRKEFSLNAQVVEDGDEWQDWLLDKELDHDQICTSGRNGTKKRFVKNSIKVLNDRERNFIFKD